MQSRNIESHRVTTEEFLSQEGIRRGIFDVYQDAKFKHFKNTNYAIAYERGRQLGICAKQKKIKLHHLYDGYGYCRGNPTSKLISLHADARRFNWYV